MHCFGYVVTANNLATYKLMVHRWIDSNRKRNRSKRPYMKANLIIAKYLEIAEMSKT